MLPAGGRARFGQSSKVPAAQPAARSIVRIASRLVTEDDRRTFLASERTNLAWVRTGLACTAVAIGIGRIAPEVAKSPDRWAYVTIGAGYALMGAVLVAFGFTRRPDQDPSRAALAIFTAIGVLLGVATFLLVVLE